jgi:hypothetical protein
VVLTGGLQRVPRPVAELLRATSVARAVRPVPAEVVAGAPAVVELPVTEWPPAAPRLRAPAEAPQLCWTWTADGPRGGAVWLGGALPVSPGAVPVPLARADGPGERLDAVAVGSGGAVRAAASGSRWLISAAGVGYPVVDDATAAAIGCAEPGTAPDAVLALLPAGPPVDLGAAGRALELAPPAPG